jgi:hypothetical protein
MPRARKFLGIVVVSSAGLFVLAGVQDAMAQKKLSYEQAYAKCKEEVVRAYPPGTSDTSGRFLRGGACMKNYGFNLKKGAKF